MEFRIPRHDNVDLVFEGELLAELSSRQENGQSRWTETRIYRTANGSYVTEMVGRSEFPGEHDRYTVAVHKNPEHVRLGLMRRQGGESYLTDQGRQALTIAAKADPTLQAALEERI